MCLKAYSHAQMRTKHPGFRVVFLPSHIRERADCSQGFAAENRLHGTAKDSLVDFNDTEMGAGRILINDLSADSPELSGNDRTGVDVEFSQRNEYWCQDSGPNALLMSWCLKELVTVYLVNTHLCLGVSICLSFCFYSYSSSQYIWPSQRESLKDEQVYLLIGFYTSVQWRDNVALTWCEEAAALTLGQRTAAEVPREPGEGLKRASSSLRLLQFIDWQKIFINHFDFSGTSTDAVGAATLKICH